MEVLQGSLGGNLVSTLREHPEVRLPHASESSTRSSHRVANHEAAGTEGALCAAVGRPAEAHPDRAAPRARLFDTWPRVRPTGLGHRKTVWSGRCREPDTGGAIWVMSSAVADAVSALPCPVRPRWAPFPNGAHVPGGASLLSRAAEPFAESRTWISAMPPARVRRRCQAARSI